MMRYFKLLLISCAIWFVGCTSSENGSAIGREFYSGSLDTQSMGERIATYSIPDQWEIYYYGTAVIHPPHFGLSKFLAKNGEPMAIYMLEYLKAPVDEMYFLNSLDVFGDMKLFGYFDYCADPTIIEKLNQNQSLMSHTGWRSIYNEERMRMPC